MANNVLSHRVTFTSIFRGQEVQGVAPNPAGVISHASMNYRDALPGSFKFEKHDGTSWNRDPETESLFKVKMSKTAKNVPDFALATELTNAANLFTVLAKKAGKGQLDGEMKAAIVKAIYSIKDCSSMAPLFVESPAAPQAEKPAEKPAGKK